MSVCRVSAGSGGRGGSPAVSLAVLLVAIALAFIGFTATGPRSALAAPAIAAPTPGASVSASSSTVPTIAPAAPGTLLFLGNRNIPPVVYLEGSVPSGLAVDMVRAIGQHMKQPIEIRAMDWKTAQTIVAQGGADALIQINSTPERQKIYDFSDPFLESHFAIFVRSDQGGISGISSLRGLKVGVEAGGLPQQLLSKDPGVSLSVIPSFPEGFRMLNAGEIDAVVVDYRVGSYVLATNNIRNIKVSGDPIASSYSAIAVRKGNEALLAEINSSLKAIKAEGTYQKILDNWSPTEGVFETQGQINQRFYNTVIVVLGILLAATVIWAVALRAQMNRTKAAEKALQESGETYRSLVTAMAEGFAFQNADGRITALNPAGERILGRRADDLLGVALEDMRWDIIHEDGSRFATDESPSLVALRTGLPQTDVAQGVHRPDGSLVWISVNARPLRFEGETTPHAVVSTFRDITERKQAEEALREAARYSRSLLEAAPDPFVTISPDGKITDVNRAAEQATGVSRAQLIGTDFAGYFTEPARVSVAYHNVLKMGAIRDIPLTLRTALGGTVDVLYNATTYVNAAGELQGVLATARDVTQLEREQALTRSVLLEMVGAIALTVEKRDPYTAGHQQRVAELAAAIAEQMGLDAAAVEGVQMGAAIHDIGKMQVPAEILVKPGKLSASEMEIIRTHPTVGAEIVQGIHSPWPIGEMILQHHERLDGSGYPEGRKGEDIVLEARILAVADVVEAMASHRPYRPARGVDAALDEILGGRGRLYDERAVDACVTLFRKLAFDFSS